MNRYQRPAALSTLLASQFATRSINFLLQHKGMLASLMLLAAASQPASTNTYTSAGCRNPDGLAECLTECGIDALCVPLCQFLHC